jgi:hypothetical protein
VSHRLEKVLKVDHLTTTNPLKAERALQGYCLAEYHNGIDADPTYFPWVQLYIDHFRTVIQPKYPSLFLASSANKPSPTSSKDLPSSTRTPKRRTRPQIRTRRNVPEEAAATD